MSIGLVWAQARDSVGRALIGAKGGMPWELPEDLRRFKRLTTGHPVVMGMNTFMSLPVKPLPNRTNVVLAHQLAGLVDPGAMAVADAQNTDFVVAVADGPAPIFLAASLDSALKVAREAAGGDQVWVIGGGSVYRQTTGLADRLEVTEIDAVVEGDTYAPQISEARWRPTAKNPKWQTAANGTRYRFRSYLRTGAAGGGGDDDDGAGAAAAW